MGDVELGPRTSIWFNTTIRADVNRIRIGPETNIQDNCVVHVTRKTAPTTIGAGVTVGHSAILHGCTVQGNILIGMGSVVLDGAEIGRDTIVGARSLVTQNTHIPPGSLVLGSPARVIRRLEEAEVEKIRQYARNYLEYSALYLGEVNPPNNPFY